MLFNPVLNLIYISLIDSGPLKMSLINKQMKYLAGMLYSLHFHICPAKEMLEQPASILPAFPRCDLTVPLA